MSPQDVRKLCEKLSTELSEHVEHVQVMVSWNEEALTHRVFYGAGNWYARQGLAHEFIQKDIAQTNADEIASKLDKSSDDE